MAGQFIATGINPTTGRSEEHTSELKSPCNLVCRPLLEKQPISSSRKEDASGYLEGLPQADRASIGPIFRRGRYEPRHRLGQLAYVAHSMQRLHRQRGEA